MAHPLKHYTILLIYKNNCGFFLQILRNTSRQYDEDFALLFPLLHHRKTYYAKKLCLCVHDCVIAFSSSNRQQQLDHEVELS